jgi:hypothetical protein
VAGELVVVGHVVPVREEDCADAAERLNPAHERAGESRRVDEDVPALLFGADDEVAPRAEARLGGEAAEVDVRVDPVGESLDAAARVVGARRPD